MANQSHMEKMVDFKYLQPYFKDKKVLLTGHTGFKGSWMLQVLARMGAKICGYSLAPQNANDLYYQIEGDNLCVNSIIEDIQDAVKVKQAILSFEPDYIFHLAAQPLVIDGYANPLYTFNVNAMGTANLLDALKGIDKKCICVCITTDKVYENPEDGKPFIETDKLGGYDPYSASKAAAEVIINSYRNSFFNTTKFTEHNKAIASARAGNVIGGGDFAANRIVPDIVKAINNNTPIVLRNPNATRPWQHVIEPIGAYLLLATKLWDSPLTIAPAYNFGPITTDVLTVEYLVKEAINIYGNGTYEVHIPKHQLHEAQNLMLDITAAKQDLHWTPKFTAIESITHTIEWYKDPQDAAVKCNRFIDAYFNASINDSNES